MINIKILGAGCPKCKKTTAMVEQAVAELGLTDVNIEKVEDIMKIMEYNVMTTPAVVIDDDIKIKGRIPSVKELKGFLTSK
ncbi:MAG: thioredoxin family protein [Saprospiraceae bacterium]